MKTLQSFLNLQFAFFLTFVAGMMLFCAMLLDLFPGFDGNWIDALKLEALMMTAFLVVMLGIPFLLWLGSYRDEKDAPQIIQTIRAWIRTVEMIGWRGAILIGVVCAAPLWYIEFTTLVSPLFDPAYADLTTKELQKCLGDAFVLKFFGLLGYALLSVMLWLHTISQMMIEFSKGAIVDS